MGDQKNTLLPRTVKAIIGLGNPGTKFVYNRHNIGFMVVDYLVEQAGEPWYERENLAHTTIEINGQQILVVKPHIHEHVRLHNKLDHPTVYQNPRIIGYSRRT